MSAFDDCDTPFGDDEQDSQMSDAGDFDDGLSSRNGPSGFDPQAESNHADYDYEDLSGLGRGRDRDTPMSDPGASLEWEVPEVSEPEVKSQTVEEFVSCAKYLLQAGAMDDFTKFVLTGVLEDVQFQVDPIKDSVQDHHDIQALRDYDSVLGIHANICVEASLTIYPVSKFEDTLRRNIHIKQSFTNRHGDHTDVPVHQIPNLCIAKWGTHNMIRVLLPGLYDGERRTPFLKQDELAIFYEKGLRPAIEELAGPSAAEWPPSYSAEMFRARGKTGTLSFQTKTLSAWLVGSLGDYIRRSLSDNDIPWGEGLLFLHQIRGVKASNGHSLSQGAANDAFEDLILANNITDDAFLIGDWWVDVGLEISSRANQCLAWRTDSHFHVVKNVLQIASNHASRITRPGSSKYIRDMTSHLTSVSGCRICPGVRAQGPHEAVYLQMYTTDKSITYRPEGTHFGKFLKGEDIIKGKADDYCRGLYELYRQAADKNYALARIEIRVPAFKASSVLLNIDVNSFRDGLVVFDPVVWWSLRAYRVLAFKYVLTQQARGPFSLRGRANALLLTAAAPWFLNGLHSAPDNGPSSRDLMGKILPLVDRVDADVQTLAYPASTRAQIPEVEEEEEEDDEEDGEDEEEEDEGGAQEDNMSVHSMLSDDEDAPAPRRQAMRRHTRPETLPYNPYGIVFLRDIRIGKGIVVPRFRDSNVAMITPQTFRYIFNIDFDDIDAEFFKAQVVVPSNPHRVANKTHRTAARFVDEVEPPRIFDLSARGYQLPPPAHDEGSDAEVLEISDEEEVDIDAKLTKLWRQFLLDLTSKVCNRQGADKSSYCALDDLQRQRVNEQTYRNLRLRDYFNDCQFKIATKKEWSEAFNKLWPEKGKKLVGKVQNYPTMKYYLEWGILINGDDDGEIPVEPMREVLRKRFSSLKWIPNVQSDRIWITKPDRSFSRFPESDPRNSAPRVLIKWGEEAIV